MKQRRIVSMLLLIMMLFSLIPTNNTYGLDGAINNGVVSIKSVYGGMTISEKDIMVFGDYQTIYFSTVVPSNKYVIDNVKHNVSVTFRGTGKTESRPVGGGSFSFNNKLMRRADITVYLKPAFEVAGNAHTDTENAQIEKLLMRKFAPTSQQEVVIDVNNNMSIKNIAGTPGSGAATTVVSREDYLKTFRDILVQEAGFNKNLKSYTTNIAFFFSEKGVLPPSKAIVNDVFYDMNEDKTYTAGIDKKINTDLSVDYEKELLNLEKSNMLNSTTSVVDLQQLIALYLYYSPEYMPASNGIITKTDVDKYKVSNDPTYNWPTNVPCYIDGNYKGSYNLAKDDFIVGGRNQVMHNFIAAYNESYELAYNNPDKETSGLSISDPDGEGWGGLEFSDRYGLSDKTISAGGKYFLMPKSEKGKILDFELFALSMNQARTIIGFRNNPSEFMDYTKTPTAASLGFGVINAPVTNLLYTGGVANEANTDYAEYSGYYVKPYDNLEPLSHTQALLEVQPIQFDGMYLEEIMDTDMQQMLVDSIKTGIRQIDDNTGARSFNPDVWFGYYNIRNGSVITNGYTRAKTWATESDMAKEDEGLFFKKKETSAINGEEFTKIFTTAKFKELDRQGKFKEKNDAFLDHIVITEFPTMYTWGQGVAIRINQGGQKWYVDVPLAPISLTRDVEVFVEGETMPADDGAFETNVRVRFDNMPYLPIGMTSENIIFEILGKDIDVVSIESTDIEPTTGDKITNIDEATGKLKDEKINFKYVQFAQHEYERENESKVKVKLNDRKWDANDKRAYYDKLVKVTWKAKPTVTADSKIVFTANLVSDDTWNEIISGGKETAELISMRTDMNSEISAQLGTINNTLNKYTGEILKYSEFYPETDYDNNYAMLPIKADVDLGLEGYDPKFDKATGKQTIDIYGFLRGRDLIVANGELPVEVRMDWETWDGQSGTQTLTTNELDKAGEAFKFEFKPNIIPPADGSEPGGVFTIEINPKDIPKEVNRDNNIYVGVEFGSIPTNTLDFDIYTPFTTAPVINDGVKTNVDFKAHVALNNVLTTENTVVKLFTASGTLLDTRNVSVKGGDTLTLNYSLPIASLSEGINNMRIVVNTDFTGSAPSPIASEINLANNIYNFSLNKITTIGNPVGCFKTSTDSESYGKLTITGYNEIPRSRCVERVDGKCVDREHWIQYVPIWECVQYSVTLNNDVTISAVAKSELKSDLWSNDRNAQDKVKGNSLYPLALNASGNAAKDDLLKLYNINQLNQLKQVIRAGHGLAMEAVVTIEGTVEQAGSESTAYENVVNQVLNGTYMNGDGKVGGTTYPEIQNNEGKLEQKMELNGTILRTVNTTSRVLGDCEPITVYTTTFKIEIPMRLVQATGKIAVNSGDNTKARPDVPKENKWFVYLNQPDNVGSNPHVFKVESTVNWSSIGASGTTDCEVQIPKFNIGVYGTMYDLINTGGGGGNTGGGDDGWDN